LSLN
jgi:sterol desaturase/sphingolipid hydroxylase (fatty acid hydroxylase superfamily)